MTTQGKLSYLKLPPELKQEHGDGIIMCAENDLDLQNDLMSLISEVLPLDDGSPPNVIPLDEACPWVQNVIDNLEKSMEYYTLVFCVITESLLKSRYFVDAAFLDLLDKNKETFIPVFKNREAFEKMKNSPDTEDKLPSLYRLVKPVYLESKLPDSRLRMVKQLRNLFNCHINAKLSRFEKHEIKINEALERMNSNNNQEIKFSSIAAEPQSMPHTISMQSGSTYNSSHSDCTQTDDFMQNNTSFIAEDQLPSSVNPPTALETQQAAAAAAHGISLQRDLSVDGDLETTNEEGELDVQPSALQTRQTRTAVNNFISIQKEASTENEATSNFKTPVQVSDEAITNVSSRPVNSADMQEKSLKFNLQCEGGTSSKNLASNTDDYKQSDLNTVTKKDEEDALCSNDRASSRLLNGNTDNSNGSSSSILHWEGLGYLTIGIAVGAAVMYSVTK